MRCARFELWYPLGTIVREFEKERNQKKTLLLILRIAVRLLLLGLYKTAVETSLRIFNCDTFEGNSVWKDNQPCPLGGDDHYLAVIGIVLLVLYGLLPYLCITVQLIRNGRPKEHDDTRTFGYVLYGWATEGYKSYAYLWEPVNALIIMLTVAAATLFDGQVQTSIQASIAGASIVLHAVVRPYEERDANFVVVLFGVCELLGIIGAKEQHPSGRPST